MTLEYEYGALPAGSGAAAPRQRLIQNWTPQTTAHNAQLYADPCTGVICPPGLNCVGGACVDLSCQGVMCPPGQQCVGGACIDPNPAPPPSAAATDAQVQANANAQAAAERWHAQQQAAAQEQALADKAAQEAQMAAQRKQDEAAAADAGPNAATGGQHEAQAHSQADPAAITCPSGYYVNMTAGPNGPIPDLIRPCVPENRQAGGSDNTVALTIGLFILKQMLF